MREGLSGKNKAKHKKRVDTHFSKELCCPCCGASRGATPTPPHTRHLHCTCPPCAAPRCESRVFFSGKQFAMGDADRPTDHLQPPAKKRGSDRQLTKDDASDSEGGEVRGVKEGWRRKRRLNCDATFRFGETRGCWGRPPRWHPSRPPGTTDWDAAAGVCEGLRVLGKACGPMQANILFQPPRKTHTGRRPRHLCPRPGRRAQDAQDHQSPPWWWRRRQWRRRRRQPVCWRVAHSACSAAARGCGHRRRQPIPGGQEGRGRGQGWRGAAAGRRAGGGGGTPLSCGLARPPGCRRRRPLRQTSGRQAGCDRRRPFIRRWWRLLCCRWRLRWPGRRRHLRLWRWRWLWRRRQRRLWRAGRQSGGGRRDWFWVWGKKRRRRPSRRRRRDQTRPGLWLPRRRRGRLPLPRRRVWGWERRRRRRGDHHPPAPHRRPTPPHGRGRRRHRLCGRRRPV